MSKLPICSMKGDRLGELSLADGVLELKKGGDAVAAVVDAHRARMRAGTAATKTRGMVAGGGAKPWKQKGTGRARAGSSRSPVWKGGGTVFGPHPKSYDKKVTHKTQQLAFRRAFSEKVAAGEVIVVDKIEVSEPKTKTVADALRKMKADKGALIVLESPNRNVTLAARNIRNVEVVTASNVHTYQILRFPAVVVSRDAMAKIEARLAEKSRRTK